MSQQHVFAFMLSLTLAVYQISFAFKKLLSQSGMRASDSLLLWALPDKTQPVSLSPPHPSHRFDDHAEAQAVAQAMAWTFDFRQSKLLWISSNSRQGLAGLYGLAALLTGM